MGKKQFNIKVPDVPTSVSITKASASQMLRIMQALSAEAQEAGVANMSLDEINAEIDAARKGK
ncbi:MAG: hypothetical protein MJZ05_10335 [Fibrobacter sp.]|nr:hypothetical protein [Fibrobacter sp.]